MTTQRMLLLVIICALCGVALASDNRRDGNWWRGLTTTEKGLYVTGFFDGMDLGNNFSYWGLDGSHVERADDVRRKVIDSYNLMSSQYFNNVSSGQISEGLTKFFEDYRNRSIAISNAIWIVVNSISGKSDAEIETMTQNFRKGAK